MCLTATFIPPGASARKTSPKAPRPMRLNSLNPSLTGNTCETLGGHGSTCWGLRRASDGMWMCARPEGETAPPPSRGRALRLAGHDEECRLEG